LLACLVAVFFFSGCSQGSGSPSSAEGPVPYFTRTPSLTPSLFPALTEFQILTATPVIYTVVENDTLIGIAQRFGVTLEMLQAANPGVEASSLFIGAQLIIPTGAELPGEPSPTPVPFTVLQARCWPETGGGLWCFALVQNPFADRIENLAVQFTLLDTADREIDSQISYGLLDILPSGESMLLVAHFPAPMPLDVSIRVQVLTGNRLLPGDDRYLPASVSDTLVTLDATGRTANVSGRVLLSGAGTANLVWVLANAYDASGNVVGVRRWEADSILTSDAPVPFSFDVFSVGPPIAQVDFLVEARP
jgi:LysM repeat protein